MNNLQFALDGAWRVLLAGLVMGAGLPAVFAVGIRAMAFGSGGDAEVHAAGTTPAPHPAGRALAALCFAVVLVAIALGITFIVASGFGKELSIEHGYPILRAKGH